MKKFANNSATTGYATMTVFQKTTQQIVKRAVRGLLCTFAVVLLITGFATSVLAYHPDWYDGVSTFYVDDEDEFLAAIEYKLPPGITEKTIILTRNFGVDTSKTYVLNNGETVTLNLNGYNFMGNDKIRFHSLPGNYAELVIQGSTLVAGGGFELQGDMKLTYMGIYTSTGSDFIIFNNTGIEVDITTPGSAWDALNHDVSIGFGKPSLFILGSGNWARSKNVVVGNSGGYGNLIITGTGPDGKPTKWDNSANLYVGGVDEGILVLSNGAKLITGNLAVGVGTVLSGTGPTIGTGIVNISGAGTLLDIIGSNAADDFDTYGKGFLSVTDRARVFLRYNDFLINSIQEPSGILALGEGTSLFDNAYFMVDRGTIGGEDNEMTFQNFAMFEGGDYGFVRDISTQQFIFDNGNFGPQGGGITLNSLTIGKDAVFSPGYGSGALWENMTTINFNSQDDLVYLYNLGRAAEPYDVNGKPFVDDRGIPSPVGRYGGMDFTGDFILASGGIAIFDFDPEGDTLHSDSDAKQIMHKDFINLGTASSAELNGTVHFRPMPGYYRDTINIDFITNGSVTSNPELLSLWPQRWFENWDIIDGAGGATLVMSRSKTPFSDSADSYNEQSVGVALDWIYNREQAAYENNLMLSQQNDSEWFPVLDWVWGLNDADFRTAMRQLSGEARAASFYMPLRSPWRYGFDRVNWRKRDNHVYFGQQNILAPYIAKQDVWVTPYYDSMHTGDDGNTSSTDTSRTSFMAGYDRVLSKYAALGFLFGYSQPKMTQVYSRIIADDYLFGLHYNTRIANDYELKLWGGYGVQHYRASRHVPINHGGAIETRYGGNSATASVQIAKPYSFFSGVIRPLAALDYSFVQQDDSEAGGYLPIALRYHSSDWSQLFGRLGVRGDFGWKRFSLTSSVSYSYQIAGDVEPTVTNQFVYGGPEFDIKGPNLSRTFVNVGLGGQLYLNKLQSRMCFIQYNGNYGKRTNAQNASLGYQMTF